MQSEMQKPSEKLKSARRTFSVVGLSALLLLVGQLLVSTLAGIGIPLLFPDGSCPAWLYLLIVYIAAYGIPFPLAALVLRRLPHAAPGKGTIRARHFFAFLPILFVFSYVGSFLGNLLSALLADTIGLQLKNAVPDLMDNDPLALTAIVGILAPLFEEWFFRKLFIDRMRIYGERLALLVSALLFAFYHVNLYQFFYTFLLGLVLGYVYLRTGRLIFPCLLHAIYNLYAGVLTAQIFRLDGITAYLEAETMEAQIEAMAAHPVDIVILSCFGFVSLGLLITGSVLCGKYRKKIFFRPAENQLPPDTEGAAAFVNLGMPLYIIISVIAALYLGAGS